jgi:hypothetical protein
MLQTVSKMIQFCKINLKKVYRTPKAVYNILID